MNRDALIFFSDFDDAEVWKKTLLSELPDLDFRTDSSAGNPADVRYALVWKPPIGFFAGFPNIALVTNLGVDADAVVIQINEAPLAHKMKGGKTFVERAAAAKK